MIKEVNRACEKLNEALGISVPLPDPGKEELEAAAACSLAVGAGLLAAGFAFSSKWCAVLGGVSVLSAAMLRKENGGR